MRSLALLTILLTLLSADIVAAEQSAELRFTLQCNTSVHIDAIGFGAETPTATLDSAPISPVTQLGAVHRYRVPVTRGISRLIRVTGKVAAGVTPRVELAYSRTVRSGTSLISNPFAAADQRISAQFADAPIGTQVFLSIDGKLQPSSRGPIWIAGDRKLPAGQGAIIRLPKDAKGNEISYTIQFRGRPSDRRPFSDAVKGWNLIGNTQPCEFVPDVGIGGDVFRWNGLSYNKFSQEPIGWIPFEPRIPAGEAVWVNIISPPTELR